jgi:hypothetical protein
MESRAVGHNFEMGLPKDYPSQIWYSGFRGEDSNVIFYQNMPNLHNKMSSNFNCCYMARSSLTYIRGFSVKFFFQPIYTDYAN